MTIHLMTLFVTVMATVTVAGYWLMSRREAPGTFQTEIVEMFAAVGQAVPAGKSKENPVRLQLAAAGYRKPAALKVFQGIKCLTALIIALILGAMALRFQGTFFPSLIAFLCGAAFGYLLPARVLRMLTRTRAIKLRRGLVAALDLLVLCSESGQSIDSSITDTSRNLKLPYPDLSSEFKTVHLELLAGHSRAEALAHLALRNGEPELRKLVNVLTDCDRFGTRLAPALRVHANHLRTRMRQQAQEAARKISVKLVFPVFFLIFPSVILVTLGPALLQVYFELRPILTGDL